MTRPTVARTPLGPALRNYFCAYLMGQRELSPRTVQSYRDTFRLLLRFLQQQRHLDPEDLDVEDLDAPRVLAFLQDLEHTRHNSPRSRNARLAAIRSFLRQAAAADPLLLPVAQKVPAIPAKRFERASVGHLTVQQVQALIQAPDPATAAGRRDRLLLLLLYNTGGRVSEIAGLQVQDVCLDGQAFVHIRGKGRKHRCVPLWQQTVRLLRPWLRRGGVCPQSPLLTNARGQALSRSGIAQRLRLAVRRAARADPALKFPRISPHTLRHTTAMHLLQSGVELSVIALWLGHENVQTTHQYLEADLDVKRKALACLQPPCAPSSRHSPLPPLMQFLDGL